MTDLDTLRPEVREALAICEIWMPDSDDDGKTNAWYTIRAELLRLARENAGLRGANKRMKFLLDSADAEVAELRAVCAATYQAAGCYGLPVRFLDALSNAMHGEKLHKVDLDKLLPVAPVDWVERAERAEAKAATGCNYQIVMLPSYKQRRLGFLSHIVCIGMRPQLYLEVPGCSPWQVMHCAHDEPTVFAYLHGLVNGAAEHAPPND